MFGKIANGNIKPYRLVKLDTTTEGRVLQCSTGDKPWGVSQMGTHLMALNDGIFTVNDGYAAIQNEPINIFGPGEEEGQLISLLIGIGGCTIDDYLGPDTDGRGITITAAGVWYACRALATRTVNQICPVFILPTAQLYT